MKVVIIGACNIPQTEVRKRLGEVPRDREIIILCGVGKRSYMVFTLP